MSENQPPERVLGPAAGADWAGSPDGARPGRYAGWPEDPDPTDSAGQNGDQDGIAAQNGTGGKDGFGGQGGPAGALAGWAEPSSVLFDGDQGGLELDQRRALVALVKQRFISSETHPHEWRALMSRPDDIVSRLNDQFLTLHLDPEREVAWKCQAQPEGSGSFPTLLYNTTWNREATIVLVFLRTRQRAEAIAGNPLAFVDREEIISFIEERRPDSATDQSGDAGRAQRAVDELYSARLLLGRKRDDRFQIARALEALLPLDMLKHLRDAITASLTSPEPHDMPRDSSGDSPERTPEHGPGDRPGETPGETAPSEAAPDPRTEEQESR